MVKTIKKNKKIHKTDKITIFNKINITSFIVIILILLLAQNMGNINNIILNTHKEKVENLWSNSQAIQKYNFYEIEAEHKHTDPFFKTFKSLYKTYKTPNMWYSQYQEYLSSTGDLSSTVYIKFFDGSNIYRYLTTDDGKTQDMYGPQGVVYSDGTEEHSEYKKHNPNTTLKDSINRENMLNILFNWYNYDASASYNDWVKDEQPQIIGNKTINGLNCTYIQFYKKPTQERYACINKDYGVAIYHKLVIVPPVYKNTNTPIMHEYLVTKIKNSTIDNYKVDYSILNLPNNMYIRSNEEFAKEPG